MRHLGVKGVILGLGYALAYLCCRELSVSHWLLTAGLRFAALLFLPYRSWPAILLGDVGASAYFRHEMIGDYGYPWFFTSLLTPVAAYAPAVWLLRALGWNQDRDRFGQSIGWLLCGALMAALLSATGGIVAMDLIHYGDFVAKLPEGPAHYLAVFTIGDFLGILCIVPATVAVHRVRRWRAYGVPDLRRGMESDLARSLGATALALALLILAVKDAPDAELQAVARIVMLVPVVLMTCRYGWIGAVPAVLMGNIALQATMTQVRGAGLVNVQAMMSIIGSGALLFGAMITEGRARAELLARESRKHLQLARSNLQWGESWANEATDILEQAYDALMRNEDVALPIAVGQTTQAVDRARSRWLTVPTQRVQLQKHIEALRMTMVHTHGLKLALMAGPVYTMLQEVGIKLKPRVSGDSQALPSDMHVMLYRLVLGFIMRLAREHRAERIRVRVIIKNGAQRNIVVVVRAIPGRSNTSSLPTPYFQSHDLRAIAKTYQGLYHDRSQRPRPTLAILLRDV